MELEAYTVSTNLAHYAVTALTDKIVDRRAHVTQEVPWLNFFQADLNTLFGNFHQPLFLRRNIANAEHAGRIGVIAI